MKFLFDQSADFRLIPHLQALGHDVSAISRNYPRASGVKVWPILLDDSSAI